MNFAEKLIDWKENNQEIKSCEHKIKCILKAKAKFIEEKLKTETPEGEIGVYTFKSEEFLSHLQESIKIQHNKFIDKDVLHLLLIASFNSSNKLIVQNGINEYEIIVWNIQYPNADEKLFSDIIKTWFEKCVLLDFEESFKKAHNERVRFSATYSKDYMYESLFKVFNTLCYIPTPELLLTRFEELANNSGLQFLSKNLAHFLNFELRIS